MSTRWTQEQVNEYQRRSVKSLKANCDPAGGETSSAQPEPPVRHEPVAEKAGEAGDAKSVSRRLVRITSYRRRLLDPDNLTGGCKYLLDCCTLSQLIPDDRPQDIELTVRQEKVKSRDLERTEILIEPLP